MQKIYLSLILSLLTLSGFSQQRYPVTYQQLKEYEGHYEYINHTTLKIAASPTDTLLYAIINESRYRLKPSGKDLFLNMGNQKIQFFRDKTHHITGYTLENKSYQLLDKHVFFPQSIWYPRLASAKNFHYKYQQPKDLKDQIQIGSINQSGLDTALLSQMMHKIIKGDYPNVHSILIIKDGKLVFEEYFYEYTKDSLQELRSATKSFVSALTGIAIDKGFIKSKSETVLSYFPEYTFKNMSEAKKKITLEHLLSNQNGLDYDITNPKAAGNEVDMGYTDDWVKYTLDLPMIDTLHVKGMYSSGNPVILGRIIEKTTHQALPDFASQTLFNPMGIKKFKWHFKPDKSSAETFCQLYLTPREMAKFGLLYLNKGNWNGQQLVSAGWVSQSLEKHAVVQGVDYGYLWWLKHLDADGVRYYGKAAQGNGGQKIYLWEDQHMVTVITGGSFNSQSSSDELIKKYILPAFNQKK
ncbi:serine hydrolase [Pedobacter sp. L105]|uniref:serine hydrolase domain-containing protein n=1 Tax=Pedobacter sp. L105 TaxID=1641871 RepID=UPI00131C74AD|nr:serine hydrolase [Pedobacter sp. L105]